MARSNRPQTKKSPAPARGAQDSAQQRAQDRAKERAPAAAPPPPHDDDPVPDDIHEFRRALAQKIMTLLGIWRCCLAPACRRARRCTGPDLRCQRDFPAPTKPEQEARALAEFQHALRRRAGEVRS